VYRVLRHIDVATDEVLTRDQVHIVEHENLVPRLFSKGETDVEQLAPIELPPIRALLYDIDVIRPLGEETAKMSCAHQPQQHKLDA
jgi:hypothetical protein